jgi:glutamine---fructose-6-phosphate transaminase (isomerizing)
VNAAGTNTRMFREAAEAPERVRRQLAANAQAIESLSQSLRREPPRAVVTCARGSSDHAATFAKYLIETRVGLLTASAAPSISSVYAAKPDLQDVLFLAISQSGASPDLLATAEAARAAGARIVALVNAERSPLAEIAHHVIPLHAGDETSVAATKSFIASLAAIAHLVAGWTGARELLEALERAPAKLAAAWALDWSAALQRLESAASLYVIGRGLGLGVAQEAALKLKETCGLHAEAHSAAEVKHGPMALIRPGFPVIVFSQDDETRAGIELLATELVARGADVILAGAEHPRALTLPSVITHAAIEPMLIAQSFYRLANGLALARGRNPDQPPHLKKVTETV